MYRNTRKTLLALPLLTLVSGCQWNDDPALEAQPSSVEDSAGTASRPSADKLEQAFPGQTGALKTAILVDTDGEETEITYEVINGLAVYQGDIILGKESKLESQLQGAGIELRLSIGQIVWCITPSIRRCQRKAVSPTRLWSGRITRTWSSFSGPIRATTSILPTAVAAP